MMNILKLYCTLLVLISTFDLRADDISPNSNCITNPPNFQTLSWDAARQAGESQGDEIYFGRLNIDPEYSAKLLGYLKSGAVDNDNKALVINLLGRLRTTDLDVIDTLIRNVDFVATRFEPADRIRSIAKYPAQQALMLIGKPAIDPILNSLSNESNNLRRKLLCEVLGYVEGKEVVQTQIKQKIPEVQANLQSALKELEK